MKLAISGSTFCLSLSSAVALAVVLSSSSAHAQDVAPPAPTTANADAAGSDHARVVGRFAVGFLGVSTVPVASGTWSAGAGGCGQPAGINCYPVINGTTAVPAPVIGVRYWFNEKFGIDAGIGLGLLSGSTDQYVVGAKAGDDATKFTVNKTSYTAFLLHAGVPIALSTGKHFTFEVIPEVNVGFGSGTAKDQIAPQPPGEPLPANTPQRVARPDLGLGGFLIDVGARIGGEIQLGFIGVPELALQATVGLHVASQSTKVTVASNSVSDSNTTIGTSVQSSPWAVFTNNIAALYYF